MTDLPENIGLAVREIKSAIIKAQSRVAANANAEMLSLYFGIGRYVAHKTQTEKWGTGVIDAISRQLQKEMPGLRGFSSQSIRKMRQFYETWAGSLIWQPTAAELQPATKEDAALPPTPVAGCSCAICSPAVSKLEFRCERHVSSAAPNALPVTAEEFLSLGFSHHMTIISQVKTAGGRLFYIHETARNRWSREQLISSIRRDDFHHRGEIPSNFMSTIPNTALARKTLAMFRDEYLLDFVNLDDIEATSGEDVDERVVEKSIVENIQRFISEFGRDFSFIGNQYRVEAAGHEHFIDLLFFNRELNALVAVELKKGAFKPIYLGQLNLYLQALDDTMKKPHENASVGIILCQSADKPYVEYAIRDYRKPLGVATYRTSEEMPKRLRDALPPIDELRKQLSAPYAPPAGEPPTPPTSPKT